MEERKELVEELTPLIEKKIEGHIRITMTNMMKKYKDSDSQSEMKLSEQSFKKLWENEQDDIWDTY